MIRKKLGEPRYFYYWKPEAIKSRLSKEGFEWLDMAESYTNHNQANWMHIILKKH